MSRTLIISACALAMALCAGAAMAQDAPEGPETGAPEAEPVVTLEFELAVVSDYRDRGYSLSDEKPALQGGVVLTHRSGFYGAGSFSTIAESGVGSDGDGSRVELGLLAGWAGSVGGFDLDLAVSGYLYPDGADLNFVEIPVSVSRTWNAWTVSAGVYYAPAQDALGGEDNTYAWSSLDWAPDESDWAFTAWVGREKGAWSPDTKTDWGVGVRRAVGRYTLGLTWMDADAADADSAVVAEVRAAF